MSLSKKKADPNTKPKPHQPAGLRHALAKRGLFIKAMAKDAPSNNSQLRLSGE